MINGAQAFILECVQEIRCSAQGPKLRMDSAFFSDAIIGMLNAEGVEFSIGVPFEFTELKGMIERRKRWHRLGDRCDFSRHRWKPKMAIHKTAFSLLSVPETGNSI